MANPNWNKNKSKEQSYEEAWNFINSYINSPGFKRRLYNHNSSNNAVLNKPSLKSSSYSSYNPLDNIVYLGNDYNKYGIPNLQYAAAHELGHAVDTSMSEHINPSKLYSYTYPIFYNNSKFREVEQLYKQKFKKDLLSDPKALDQTVKNNYKEFHDAFPSESYADLMSLRTQLYRAGIYDSRKANSPFTKQHLEQFKKINPDFRLFKYFSDEDIITMMNEVAYSPIDNQLLYAKQGTKMNTIERFKKGRKVKIILPNGKVGEEREIGNYIKLKDEKFWRRVNSDGTLTRIGDRSYEYNIGKVRSKSGVVERDTKKFISNRNAQELDLSYKLENPEQIGVFPDYIIQYKDPNGKDMDVGPGLKVGDYIEDKPKYTHSEIAEAHANYVHDTDSILNLQFAQKFGKGSFDRLHPKFKALARDVKYQNGSNSKSPIMWEAMIKGDTIQALNESRSYFTNNNNTSWDNARVARRAEVLWPNMYNISTDQKDKNFKVTLKTK